MKNLKIRFHFPCGTFVGLLSKISKNM